MCTVTYLPTKTGFILSSNRDESPTRAATPLVREKLGNRIVSFPRDLKGGSWIFSDDLNRVLVVLNGAFKKHSHLPPYRKSRGLIAKEYFTYEDTLDFIRELDLNGIEPFTMIIKDQECLWEFRWDEEIKHVQKKNSNTPHIWSSSTLYTSEIQKLRENWFWANLPNSKTHSLSTAKFIHRSGDIGDPKQNYVMNRENIVRTVSISHVEIENARCFFYMDSLL
jgi:uncharacterized protein with NRDE domain